MDNLLQDIRYGIRMLAKRPAVSAVAVLSLALGIGANTTIFTVVNAVFLSTVPVEDPASLVQLWTSDIRRQAGGGNQFMPMSYLNYRDYAEQAETLSDLGAIVFAGGTIRHERMSEPQNVGFQLVTGNYFDFLGVEIAVGRAFSVPVDESDNLGAHPQVVISHGLWERLFGSEPDVVGSTLYLNENPMTVVGVAGPGYKGITTVANPDIVWVPVSMRQQIAGANLLDFFESRRGLMTLPVGRLAEGATVEQAQAEVSAIADRLREEYPDDNEGRGATVTIFSPVNPNQRDQLAQVSFMMMGVVGLVLLIACANVANLLLARAVEREKEIGLRVALGAARLRLIRQLLTESVLLALAGGLVGLLIAYWSRELLWSYRPPFVPDNVVDLSLDPRVLAFTLGVSVLTGLVFGLMPALQSTRVDLRETLQEGGRGSSLGARNWLRRGLVIGEIALALVALVGSGLFVRSMRNAQEIDPGFETERLVLMFLNLASAGYDEAGADQFYREFIERGEAIGGVESVSISSNFPLGGGMLRSVFPVGQEIPEDKPVLTTVNEVSPGYFATLGIPMLRGRDFSEFDKADTQYVAIVNEACAQHFWPDQDPIGQRFDFYDEPNTVEIVGLVEDSLVALGQPAPPVVYIPHLQWFSLARAVNVRTAGSPEPVMGEIQNLLRAMDRSLSIGIVATVDQAMQQQLWAPRMGATLLAIFGLLALGLSSVGIYGVMSNAVDQRSREIGIRMALGARASQVVGMVLRQGMVLTVAGAAIGVLLAMAVAPQLQGLLYDLDAIDPLTFTVVTLVLVAVALLATLLPARRVVRVDPAVSLRVE